MNLKFKKLKQKHLKRLFQSFIILVVAFVFLLNLLKIKTILNDYQGKKLVKLPFMKNYSEPILFLSGIPRSGLTVVKDMLFKQKLASCSESTSILSNFFSMVSFNYQQERLRGLNSNINK